MGKESVGFFQLLISENSFTPLQEKVAVSLLGINVSFSKDNDMFIRLIEYI